MDQNEHAIRQRVEVAVERQPGPDPARLASIRTRLNTQRSVGRRNLWLAAALAAALGSTAAVALWVQHEWEAEPTTDEQSGHDADQTEDETTDEASEPVIEPAPAQPEDHDEDPQDPVIFRE